MWRDRQIRASGGEGEDGGARAGTLGSDDTVGLHGIISILKLNTTPHPADISIAVAPQKKSIIMYEETERDEQKSKITRAVLFCFFIVIND